MQKNRVTQSVIIGLTTLVATAAWAGLSNILSKDGNWVLPVIGFFVLLIFLSLNWLLTKSKTILLITLFFVLISFLFPFGFKVEYLLALIVAFLLFHLGSQRAVDEKRGRIKIDAVMVLKRGLPLVMTGLALLIATAYYFSPLALTGQNQITIPRPIFDKVIGPIIGNIEGSLPVNQVAQQFGIDLNMNVTIASDEIKDDLYNQINSEINKQSQAYKEYLTLGSAVGIFFALKVIGFPFMWISIFLTWVIFKILVASGAIKIQEKAVLKEIIEV